MKDYKAGKYLPMFEEFILEKSTDDVAEKIYAEMDSGNFVEFLADGKKVSIHKAYDKGLGFYELVDKNGKSREVSKEYIDKLIEKCKYRGVITKEETKQ